MLKIHSRRNENPWALNTSFIFSSCQKYYLSVSKQMNFRDKPAPPLAYPGTSSLYSMYQLHGKGQEI